ncbi:hydrolase [Sporosarcina saromensis]|uniref:Hydrolase n=1 Tax=Sporosarcina saromensis TaxID=359365 RepID=A0ABU4G4U8_9BACL|nr:hydrolase [Sporosarcina saromensis]MDW0111988.1 hydrolase [Sporosarcina saromensis]
MNKREQTVFVLVDVQGKLSEIVHESEKMLTNLRKLIQGLQVLDIPILWLEQYPDGLGPTNEKIARLLEGTTPIPKMTFSAFKTDTFKEQLQLLNRNQVLIAGIETHICVYQTAVDLQLNGYDVQVVEDAVSSRTNENKEVGLRKMAALGVQVTSVEMALYELMERADDPAFKQLLKIIK